MKKTDLRFSFALTALACAVALATAAKAELPQYSVNGDKIIYTCEIKASKKRSKAIRSSW